MTETEAKGKWCPMVRAINWTDVSECISNEEDDRLIRASSNPHNRMLIGTENELRAEDYVPGGYHCIASGCMMWRWTLRSDGERSDEHGYCGLAGPVT